MRAHSSPAARRYAPPRSTFPRRFRSAFAERIGEREEIRAELAAEGKRGLLIVFALSTPLHLLVHSARALYLASTRAPRQRAKS